MPRLEVDKQRFKSFLSQFVGDVPFQIELIREIMSQMPKQAVDGFVSEIFYEQIYDGPLYIARHAVFKEDVRYFPSLDGLLIFLNGVNKFTNEFNTDALLTIDKKTIQKRIADRLPLCGYLLSIREADGDGQGHEPAIREYNY